METAKRRKVRVICFTEAYLDELDEGHLFQLIPKDGQVNPNLDPNAILRVSMSTKDLNEKYSSDNIEAEKTCIATRHSNKVKIENYQSLKGKVEQ
ncbi:hypothetical protein MASR1M48_17240 [Lactococcus petauri]